MPSINQGGYKIIIYSSISQAIIAIFITLGVITAPIPVKEIVYTNPEPIVVEVQERVELFEELYPICSCEGGRDNKGKLIHYGTDGELLRGRINPLDRGMCQINEYYWGDLAEELRLDWLNNEDDYNEFANHIYRTAGSSPWYLSKYCWDR